MRRPFCVYVLKDPRNYKIKYVGSTINPKQRLQSHCWLGQYENGRRAKWVRALRERGMKPIMKIVKSNLTVKEAAKEERALYQELIAKGIKLLNAEYGSFSDKRDCKMYFNGHYKLLISDNVSLTPHQKEQMNDLTVWHRFGVSSKADLYHLFIDMGLSSKPRKAKYRYYAGKHRAA